MRCVYGDLLDLATDGAFDVIVHGCNCWCAMGAGIAAAIRTRFPAAYAADCATPKGDRGKLGTCSSARVTVAGGQPLVIVNAYTQFDYAGPGVLLDYEALGAAMACVARDHAASRIGYPRIGAGLAGGQWPRCAAVIEAALDGLDHTLVEYRR